MPCSGEPTPGQSQTLPSSDKPKAKYSNYSPVTHPINIHLNKKHPTVTAQFIQISTHLVENKRLIQINTNEFTT
jgi:hypothetical protein